MSTRLKEPLPLFAIILVLILVLTYFGPAEKTLGGNVRLVYLHGAWVWTALIGFAASALAGALGLVRRADKLHRWSRALARTALLFWITFIPMSMVAAQFNWNGLFLVKPRWRMAFSIAVSGALLQIGAGILPKLLWSSIANIGFAGALYYLVGGVENVMHPESPILNSDSRTIQLFSLILLGLTLFAGWQVARWWIGSDTSKAQSQT